MKKLLLLGSLRINCLKSTNQKPRQGGDDGVAHVGEHLSSNPILPKQTKHHSKT
jgi:hypothetical protein